MDADQVIEVLRALEREDVEYKVVGAVALNLLGLARATADLDIFVLPTGENIARLRSALHSVFDDPQIDEITAEDLAGDFPAIQYVPPAGVFHIDILSRLGEAFRFEDIEVEARTVEEMRVPVATPEMLYRMKKDTTRMQDKADADRLRRWFDLEE